MKTILVLVQSYPSQHSLYEMAYVHSRNIEYLKQGYKVEVLSFSAKESYSYDGVQVFNKKKILDLSKYTVVLSHAPNIRNHFFFILKNIFAIKKLILFFHGHEVLILKNYYPKPYSWQKSNHLKNNIRWFYDIIKLRLLKLLIKNDKTSVVYVSEWMKKEANKCLKINAKQVNKSSVIYNSIHNSFYEAEYKFKADQKKADFITIRPLDGPKYSIDSVLTLAINNPQYTFHIYGKGEYFSYNETPENVTVITDYIEQKKIPELLNHYTCAVMPTRLDAQGVMMCEIASTGMPIIVSDIDVCREMLGDFNNCIFIQNSEFHATNLNLLHFYSGKSKKIEKFSPKKLSQQEIEFAMSDK